MIYEFIGILGKRSVAKSTLFQVEMLHVPALMTSAEGLSDFQRDLKFLASGVEMPGTQILTTENRHYGLPKKFAYLKAHDELSLTVRVDKDYLSKKFFDAWEDSVYHRENGNIFYKSDYIGTIQISPMIEDGSVPYSMLIEECFPTQISNISYSWESTGTIAQFNVSFAFTNKRIVAREALFNAGGTRGGSGSSNTHANDDGFMTTPGIGDGLAMNRGSLNFDVMGMNMTGLTKQLGYDTMGTTIVDGLKQRVTTINSPVDVSSIRNMLPF